MASDLALYGAQSNANGDTLNSLLQSQTVYGTYDYWPGYPWPNWTPPYLPAPTYVYPTVVVTGTQHRVCACPRCDGSCCDCDACKIKRLEARVAELEKTR